MRLDIRCGGWATSPPCPHPPSLACVLASSSGNESNETDTREYRKQSGPGQEPEPRDERPGRVPKCADQRRPGEAADLADREHQADCGPGPLRADALQLHR